jgi:hypothetical protein
VSTVKSAGYIVVFDDQQGVCVPMGLSTDCEGAIEATSGDVALFPDRRQARRAIRISTQFARLCREQGKPANDDFIAPGLEHVHIRRVVGAA